MDVELQNLLLALLWGFVWGLVVAFAIYLVGTIIQMVVKFDELKKRQAAVVAGGLAGLIVFISRIS